MFRCILYIQLIGAFFILQAVESTLNSRCLRNACCGNKAYDNIVVHLPGMSTLASEHTEVVSASAAKAFGHSYRWIATDIFNCGSLGQQWPKHLSGLDT